MHALRVALSTVLLTTAPAAAQLPADSVGRATPRGFAVGTIDSTDQALAMAPTLAHAIQARLPGVSVSLGQGLVGSSARVWLRGPNSLLINEPLLIIDGARTHGANLEGPLANRELPSRLDDIDMETVERIEVLRGPAATAIYGPGASKGVILLTTKRGQAGAARWTAFAEGGPTIEPTAFPTNFRTTGVRVADGAAIDDCPLANQANGSCTPVLRQAWNPLERASPFQTGWTTAAGLTTSGGAAGISYFAAATHDRTEGVYETDHSRATSARLSLGASPFAGVDVRLTGAHRTDALHHPAGPWIQAGLFGRATDDPVSRGYNGDFAAMRRARRDEDVSRTTLALQTTWRARSWLRANAVLGYDRIGSETGFRTREPNFSFPEPSPDSSTRINRTNDRPQSRTATLEGVASYGVAGLAARSTLGVQHLRDDDHAWTYDAVVPDDPTGFDLFSESSSDLRRSSTGVYLQQHFGWRNRLFVTGSLRSDSPRWGGGNLDDIIGRAIDVSYAAVDATAAPAPSWLRSLRLRAAYGRGGDHAVSSFGGGGGGGLVTPTGSSLAAEQGEELEVGLDATLLGDGLQTALTLYRGTTRRGIAPVNTFQGFTYSNSATIQTSGIEASINSRLLTLNAFSWDLGALITAQRNEVKSFGGPPFLQGHQVFMAGRSIGEYQSAPYSFLDANGDNLLRREEVTVLAEFGPVGSPFPRYEAAMQTRMRFGAHVELSALLDRRAGAKLYNETAYLRCRTRCPEQNDPATPLEDQARPVSRLAGTSFAYFEDADYTKLREVRLALTLPSSVARLGGASAARFTLLGRNLHTWTSYSGLDPEVTSDSHDSIFAAGWAYQPIPRTFMARLDLTW